MKKGIEIMKELGFIDTTDKYNGGVIVKQFTKYDDKGFTTDIINYLYSGNVLEVFTNNVTNGCGSRLDADLLFAVQSIFRELKDYFKKERW